jgi:hypothetical protein
MNLKQSLDVTPSSGDVDIDLKVLLARDESQVTLKSVGQNNPILPFPRITRLYKVGTKAADFIALC